MFLLDAVQQQQSPYFLLIVIGVMFAFIYFFQWRPNKKRQKEFQALIDSLEAGSEVLLQGGVVGTITKVRKEDDLITLEIAKDVTIVTKRAFVMQILPKGTIASISDNK